MQNSSFQYWTRDYFCNSAEGPKNLQKLQATVGVQKMELKYEMQTIYQLQTNKD